MNRIKTLTLLIAFICCNIVYTQTNEGINYKAIIKDTNGNVVANQEVEVEFKIMEGQGMELIYHEGHMITTNANGLVVLIIGEGTALDGEVEAIADIEWDNGIYFYKVLIDIGNGLVDMGTDLFKSVPYAMQAKKAENVFSGNYNDLSNQPTITAPTGLEAINEGNGIGWRLKGRDPLNYGSLGLNAVDFSYVDETSTTRGATGEQSIASGYFTTASGRSSTAFGEYTSATGSVSTAIGYFSVATEVNSVAIGNNTQALAVNSIAIGAGAEATGGNSIALGTNTKASGDVGTAIGRLTTAESYAETAIGSYNTDYTPISSDLWNVNDRLFVIGNGSNSSNKSDALIILKNGSIMAPSLDISEIIDAKSLITKEYVDNSHPVIPEASSGLEALDEGNGIGWRLKGRDPDFYGVLGLGAVDFSYSYNQAFSSGALGDYSTAFGFLTEASGLYSLAMGSQTNASGDISTAMGLSTSASGDISIAIGNGTNAQSYSEIVVGNHNTIRVPNSTTIWNEDDRLFVVGNGTSSANRRSALTILKNGRTTLNSAINTNPDLVLGGTANTVEGDNGIVASDPSYSSSDIFLRSNDAVVVQLDFDNNETGQFEIKAGDGTEVFEVDESGTVRVNNVIQHSDRRLKKNITNLSYGLAEVLQLQPKSYYWKNREQEFKSLGLIAQDVRSIIKEVVVEQNNEQKMLGVNYTELIPILIKAIQEQQTQIEALKTESKSKDTAMVDILKRLRVLEAAKQ